MLRRRFLTMFSSGSLAALFGASTAPAHADPQRGTGKLADLIAKHQRANQAFEDVLWCTDGIALGRNPTDEEEAIYEAYSDVEEDALWDVLDYQCRTVKEFYVKGQYLTDLDGGQRFDNTHMTALVQSMVRP